MAAAAGTPMHVVHGLDQLIQIQLHLLFRQVMSSSAYELIDVHVHQLKHQGEAACGLVTARSTAREQVQRGCRAAPRSLHVLQYFVKLDDPWVRGQTAQRLNLAQVVHLLFAVKVVFHALDGQVLAVLGALGGMPDSPCYSVPGTWRQEPHTWAFSTSENVPSPFFAMSRYSAASGVSRPEARRPVRVPLVLCMVILCWHAQFCPTRSLPAHQRPSRQGLRVELTTVGAWPTHA